MGVVLEKGVFARLAFAAVFAFWSREPKLSYVGKLLTDSLEVGTIISGVLGDSYARATASRNSVFFPPGNIPRRGRLFNPMMFNL